MGSWPGVAAVGFENHSIDVRKYMGAPFSLRPKSPFGSAHLSHRGLLEQPDDYRLNIWFRKSR
jgi:hypothetical protein